MSGISEDVGKLRSIIGSMKNGIDLGDPIETLEWCEAEIRRLRAENKELKKVRDKAMAIGGINFCAACGDEPVLEEKTFCDNCRSDIGQSELAS